MTVYTARGAGEFVCKFVRDGEVIVEVRYSDGSTMEWLQEEVSFA